MTLYQKLKWFILSGVTETISETPQNRFKEPVNISVSSIKNKADENSFLVQATTLATSADTLSALYSARAGFEGCSLKHSAHTLDGYGAKNPTVLCLLDAPNTEDEKMGKLISGKVGEKFLKMLSAIHLDIAHNTYISSLIPWRPPGNRKPTDTESLLCRPFWEKEISLIKPKVLLLFGTNTCQQVLGINAFMKACQSQHEFQGIPVFVCPTAEAVLNDPNNYRELAWKCLQRVQKYLEQN